MATYDQGGGCACGLYKVCSCTKHAEPQEEQPVPHNLQTRYPLMASLKYRCPCANNEVIAINAMFGDHVTEEHFVWTMVQLWRDMNTEIEQHLQPQKPAAEDVHHPLSKDFPY